MTDIKFQVLEPEKIRGTKFYIGRENVAGEENYTYIARYFTPEVDRTKKNRLSSEKSEYGGWTQIAFDDSIEGNWFERSGMENKQEFIKWLRRQNFRPYVNSSRTIDASVDNSSDSDTDVYEENVHRNRIANGEFLFSDFDNDGVKNLNDKNPFDKGKPENERINDEVSLAHELKELEKLSRQHRGVYEDFKSEIDHDIHAGRVKQPESILRKLRVKYSDEVTDVIGVTILADDKQEVQEIGDKLADKHEVIKDKDFYENPKQDFYRARHLVIEYGKEDLPVEIQIKTRKQFKLHKKAHKRYKQGKEPTQDMKDKAKRLAES